VARDRFGFRIAVRLVEPMIMKGIFCCPAQKRRLDEEQERRARENELIEKEKRLEGMFCTAIAGHTDMRQSCSGRDGMNVDLGLDTTVRWAARPEAPETRSLTDECPCPLCFPLADIARLEARQAKLHAALTEATRPKRKLRSVVSRPQPRK
jgi:hypothetical protein